MMQIDPEQHAALLQTISNLKQLLLQIDHQAEQLPEYSYEDLIPILVDIRGGALAFEEERLLREMLIVRELGS